MKYEFSDNIQRGVLYLLKSSPDFYLQIANLVRPDYFEYPAHAKIFNAVSSHYEKYHKLPTDEFILEDVREDLGKSESLSDYTDEILYINNLDTSCVENPEYLLDLVEEFAKRSAMKEAIAECMVLLGDNRYEETEAIIRNALTVSREVNLGQMYFEDVKARWKRLLDDSNQNFYSTFLPSLNDAMDGGLGSKELAMVVAPPGVGKSLFLVNQAVASLIEGRKVLYVSLEMGEDRIAQRFDSIMSLVPQSRLKVEQQTVYDRLNLFEETFPDGELVIKQFPTGQATINTIRALLVQLRNYEEFEPDVVIVDYLELLRPTREGMAEYQAQQRISEELRGLAVENDILIWTATQTNREGRKVTVITDSELADAYGKIRTCDMAISLNQTEEEFDSGRMRAYVMKSRNSHQRFIVPMDIDYSILKMREGDKWEDEDAEL